MFFTFLILNLQASQFEALFPANAAPGDYYSVPAEGKATALEAAALTKFIGRGQCTATTQAPITCTSSITVKDHPVYPDPGTGCNNVTYSSHYAVSELFNILYAKHARFPPNPDAVSPQHLVYIGKDVVESDVNAKITNVTNCASRVHPLSLLTATITAPPTTATCLGYKAAPDAKLPEKCDNSDTATVDPFVGADVLLPRVGAIYQPSHEKIQNHLKTYGPLVVELKFPMEGEAGSAKSTIPDNIKDDGEYCYKKPNGDVNATQDFWVVLRGYKKADVKTICSTTGSATDAIFYEIISPVKKDLGLKYVLSQETDIGTEQTPEIYVSPFVKDQSVFFLYSHPADGTTEDTSKKEIQSYDKTTKQLSYAVHADDKKFNVIATGKATEKTYSAFTEEVLTTNVQLSKRLPRGDAFATKFGIRAAYVDAAYVASHLHTALTANVSYTGTVNNFVPLRDLDGLKQDPLTAESADASTIDHYAVSAGIATNKLVPVECIDEGKLVDLKDGNCTVTAAASAKISAKVVGQTVTFLHSNAATEAEIKDFVQRFGAAIVTFTVTEDSIKACYPATAKTFNDICTLAKNAVADADPLPFLILGWGEQTPAASNADPTKVWYAKPYVDLAIDAPTSGYAGAVLKIAISADSNTAVSATAVEGVAAPVKGGSKPDDDDASFFNGPTSILALLALIFAFLF